MRRATAFASASLAAPVTVMSAITVAVRDRFLRARVGGEDRLRSVGGAVLRQRGDGAGDRVEQAVDRQRLADHAGREDEDLRRLEVERAGDVRSGRPRVVETALAG